MVCAVRGFHRHIDVEAISRFIFQWLRTEICKNPIQSGDGLYYGLKGHGIVRGCQRIGITKINFILSRSFLMM